MIKNTRRRAIACAALMLLSGLALRAADYSSTVLADGPVGYWRMNDTLTMVQDTAIANAGSLASAADGFTIGYVPREQTGALDGSNNKAFGFIGSELSRVTLRSASSFNFTANQNFTVEAWVKPSNLTGVQRLISNAQSGQGYGFALNGNNRLRFTAFGVKDCDSATMTPALVSNQWYHAVAVRSNDMVIFYVNGVKLGTDITLARINTTANPLTLGRTAAGGEPFTGVLDEPAVYSSVLSADRIAAHYYAGLTNGANYADVVLADAPIGYWRLNETTKAESSSVVANNGSLGVPGNGWPFGQPGNLAGGAAGALLGDTDKAMSFGGWEGRVDVSNSPSLNPNSFSVECWVRMDGWSNVHQSPLTSRMAGTGGYMLYATPVNGSPRWEFWTGNGSAWDSASSAATNAQVGQWTHLVATYDADSRTKMLYVDGNPTGGKLNVSVLLNTNTVLRIGAGSTEQIYGQYFWNGSIDEVAVYSSALPLEKVAAHYQAAKGTAPSLLDQPNVQFSPIGQTTWAPYPVTLSCVITGSVPMQLQWYHTSGDGMTVTAVPNATNMTLTLPTTSAAQSGGYVLTATNALGTAASSMAFVEIYPPTPLATTLPVPPVVPVYSGGTAGIPYAAYGTPPITYQWQSNSVNIAGGTNAILKLPNASSSYANATFINRVTNPLGSLTTDPAQLNVLAPAPSTYAATATGLGPIAYWRLGEVSGNSAFDYWGGEPAVYTGGTQGSSPGALQDNDDGCFQSYGSGSYVRSLSVAPFNFTGTQPFTLSAWVKADSFPASGAARFFSNRRQVGGTGGYGLGFIANNTLRFTAFGVVDVNASVPSFTASQWYHIAAVRSNTTVYLYIDGVQKASGTAANINTSFYPLQLSGNPNFAAATDEEPFSGSIDEAAVFSRALSASEISSLYASRYGSLVSPAIVTAPVAANVYAGGTARFNVQVSGSQPMGVEWRTNGTRVPNGTNYSLALGPVNIGQNGTVVSVIITNRAGTVSATSTLNVLQPVAYTAAILEDAPVALWRLGENAGPTAFDAWGGFNGREAGPVTFGTPGALLNDVNTSATFDGTSAKIDVPYSPDLNPSAFTVEAWARVTGGAGSYRCVATTRDEVLGANQRGFIIYATSGNVWSFWTSTGSGWQTLNGPAVVTNEWTHLAAVYDGTTKYFYVNGNLVGTDTVAALPNSVRPMRIGAGKTESDTGDYFFAGDVDEVALYSNTLSADRIRHHYLLGKYSTTTAPFVITQPSPAQVIAGAPAVMRVLAEGSPPLGHGWRLEGASVAGATNAVLNIAAAWASDAGEYRAVITNLVGSVTSSPAILWVGAPPTFANVTNDLVLHLKFEDNLLDSSGKGNNGMAMGNPTFVPGRLGKALHYKTVVGTTYDYVSLNFPADLQFSSNVNFSVSYWVKMTGTPGDLPFMSTANVSYGNPGMTFAPGYQDGTWSWSLHSNVGTGVNSGYGPELINDGTWHHLLHTFDRAGLGVTYLDGVEADARSIANVGDLDIGTPFVIGQDPTGTYAESGEADIDDIGIWRRALSAYEAQSIYAAAAGVNQSFDVVGPVRMLINPEKDGIGIYWQTGTLVESSSLNGTYTPVSGAVAPYYKIPVGTGTRFFRVQP